MPSEDIEKLPEHLVLLDPKTAVISSPNRWELRTMDPGDLTKCYKEDDIMLHKIATPHYSPVMRANWNLGHSEHFPSPITRNGRMIGSQGPKQTEGKLDLEWFITDFVNWKMTLPWPNTKWNNYLSREAMQPPFTINMAAVTADNHLVYVERPSVGRASHSGAVLGLHNWGYDPDDDSLFNDLVSDLEHDQSSALFVQARLGAIRELNPTDATYDPASRVTLDDISNLKATCISAHKRAYDVNTIMCFTVDLAKEVGEIMGPRSRPDFPSQSRIGTFGSVELTEAKMRNFFNQYHDRLATTVEGSILMTAVQKFGEDFLQELPYDVFLRGDKV